MRLPPGAAPERGAGAKAGVNPTDWKHRATGGFLGEPFTLGWDVSGTVEETGVGVAAFQPGDEVFGMLSYPFGHGSPTPSTSPPRRASSGTSRPGSTAQAGALPLVSLTAWQALVGAGELQPGRRLLIHAGGRQCGGGAESPRPAAPM
ncbi:hypothetical protein SFUMM280S_10175 [Streptomyces fumanus]